KDPPPIQFRQEKSNDISNLGHPCGGLRAFTDRLRTAFARRPLSAILSLRHLRGPLLDRPIHCVWKGKSQLAAIRETRPCKQHGGLLGPRVEVQESLLLGFANQLVKALAGLFPNSAQMRIGPESRSEVIAILLTEGGNFGVSTLFADLPSLGRILIACATIQTTGKFGCHFCSPVSSCGC